MAGFSKIKNRMVDIQDVNVLIVEERQKACLSIFKCSIEQNIHAP